MSDDNNKEQDEESEDYSDDIEVQEQIEELLNQSQQTERTSATAIRKLGIRDFLNTHKELVFAKLEECESIAERADFNGEIMFIASSLPIISGLILVASTRHERQLAIEWVLSNWRNGGDPPDTLSILSALTLIYLVAKGWKELKSDPDDRKREIWARIRDRVGKFSNESLDSDMFDEDDMLDE
jgi:hypothetical protein